MAGAGLTAAVNVRHEGASLSQDPRDGQCRVRLGELFRSRAPWSEPHPLFSVADDPENSEISRS